MSSSSTSAANSSGVVSILDRVEPIAGANGSGWFGLRTDSAMTGDGFDDEADGADGADGADEADGRDNFDDPHEPFPITFGWSDGRVARSTSPKK